MLQQYRIVKTPLGYVGFVASERGLRRVVLPQRSEAATRRAILAEVPAAVRRDDLMPELADALARYFAGEPVEFNVRCDWRGYSEFEEDVWHACRRVGYGQRVSYGELAERVSRPGGARAIGMAMSRNPCPIVVPCHRVLRSDGSLGGYSGPGGVELKRRLLELEAAACAAC